MKRYYTTVSINAGAIANNLELVRMLNRVLKANVRDVVIKAKQDHRLSSETMFGYHIPSQKVRIYVPRNYIMQIPENLSYQLGFFGQTYFTGFNQGSTVADVNYRLHSMYVYCDRAMYGLVGDI